METALIVLNQIIMMFILAAVGYLLFKHGKITVEGSRTLANVLIYVSLPCVIASSFFVEFTPEKLQQLLMSTLAALAVTVISVGLSRALCRGNAVNAVAVAFSNCGFFGIPVLTAALGNEAVFYVAMYIAFANIGQWTVAGRWMKAADENGNFRKAGSGQTGAESGPADPQESIGAIVLDVLSRLRKAPFMIALVIGLFFFLTGLKMPAIPARAISFLAGLNTPIAMFTVGIYMAQTDIAAMFRKKMLYWVSFVRLLLIPLVTLAALSLIPNTYLPLKTAYIITSSCAVGSNVAVYAQLFDADYTYAVETVVISTLLSIVTLPVIVALASVLWGF